MRLHVKILSFLTFGLVSVIPWNLGLSDLAIGSNLDPVQIASKQARERLAQLSSHWAKVASKLVYWKSNEVGELTKKAQDAQIISFKFSSIANRLQSAALSAEDIFRSALERYKRTAALAQAARSHSSEATRALLLLQYVKSVREKWAVEERARALRLSQHLQNILYDLKKASEFANEAHESALEANNNIPR